MSDFLQFVDRVPTLPNRKKITHADNSVEYATVEYADEPTEAGTLLNKANFDRLNAVLGYNIPPYSQSIVESTTVLEWANLTNNNVENNIGNMTLFRTAGSSMGTQPTISKSDIYTIQTRGSYSAAGYISFDDSYNLFTSIGTMTIGSGCSVKTYDKDNNLLQTFTSSTSAKTILIGNVSKIEMRNGSQSSNTNVILSNIDTNTSTKNNNYVISLNFIDRQIVKLYIDKSIDMNNVVSNTLNEKPIDTLLQSNKYYELLYDEPNNRFIAEEVRNAN